MNLEFEDYADIDGERGIVSVMCELDGYKPLGLWVANEHDIDITESMPVEEYDRLYELACQKALDHMAGMAESYYEGER